MKQLSCQQIRVIRQTLAKLIDDSVNPYNFISDLDVEIASDLLNGNLLTDQEEYQEGDKIYD